MPKQQTTLSLPTLQLLHRCLVSQQLSVGDPNFAETAQAAATARVELEALLTELQPALASVE